MSGTYLTRSTTTRTNDRKFTFSCWFKKSTTGTDEYFVTNYESGNDFGYINNGNTDKFVIYDKAGGTERLQAESNFVIRDTNAWYHLVYSVDSTASSNRVKFYINGVDRFSDFTVATAMAQNSSVGFQQGTTSNGFRVGSQQTGSATFNGLMSHVNFVDGLQLDASAFGETDSTTGEWKIKTSPTVSEYGNNGFFILKDGNSVTDQSGKGNNFGIGGSVGSLTKTEDNPSNVFATINPLNSYYAAGTFTYGNNVVLLPNKNGAWNTGTLGMTSGKYYWEIKCTGSSNGEELQLGIADKSPVGNNAGSTAGKSFGYNANGEYGIYAYNGAFIGNAVANPYTSYGSATTNGIAMIAVDLDNNKFYAGANGTWFASGNPATGANGKTIQAVASTVDGCYYPAISTYQGYDGKVECNFGNGYFADNAVSSAGTNASGVGIFEYDVPTGYTALSTKGLNL